LENVSPSIEFNEDVFIESFLDKDRSASDRTLEVELSKEIPAKLLKLIQRHSTFSEEACISLHKTSDDFNIKNLPNCQKSSLGYDIMLNLKPLNDTRYINKLFFSFNERLKNEGIFVGCVETYKLRKMRILNKYPAGLNYAYYFFDYVFKRVFPKVKFLNNIYFFITAGRNRAISKTEGLGRLSYCGFEILDTIVERGLMYFVAKKIKTTTYTKEKNYGILLKLPRQGKNGKIIQVYKLRTMFPYAEYIQAYVYQQNQLQSGGKFQNDFRISLLGRKFRKYFLDELPMFFNLLKGELKLVGVRPLSGQYFNLYNQELQAQRLKHKPGLIPPYYADLPTTLDEIQASEKKYLDSHEKAPFKTDIRYLFMALNNIFFKNARSK
jgi:lipopolysaccharide/colanic/teichoic acid biosynthesis glycosyltransferase